MLHSSVLALVALGGIGIATSAAAVQPVQLTSVGIYNPGHVDVMTGTSTASEYAVPLTFTVKSTKGADFDALGFCVDLAHSIEVNVGSQRPISLTYHDFALTTDGYGNAVSKAVASEIEGLATLGFKIAKSAGADKPAQLAAIQQAIWTVEYPKSTFTATGDYTAAQAGYAKTYVDEAATLHGHARFIAPSNGNTQAFVTDIGGVPEPTTWVELVAGFGLIGVLARRRATLTVVAA